MMEVDKISGQKKGKWIKMSDSDGVYWACSECGEDLPRVVYRFDPQFDLFPTLKSIDKTRYCPHCGADMSGEEELTCDEIFSKFEGKWITDKFGKSVAHSVTGTRLK